mmetsp:Transcript_46348/g.149247  ORF Transcript_46348/g.149247 Transcript_46348/m.149247 type:complete len:214 (+) Transcript_46348:363-1004(+)
MRLPRARHPLWRGHRRGPVPPDEPARRHRPRQGRALPRVLVRRIQAVPPLARLGPARAPQPDVRHPALQRRPVRVFAYVVPARRGPADPVGGPAAGLPAQVPLLGAALPRGGGHACVALAQRAAPRLSVGIRRADVRACRGGVFARGGALGAHRPRKHAGQAEHRPPQLALPRANLPLDGALRVRGGDVPRRLQRERRPTRLRDAARLLLGAF